MKLNLYMLLFKTNYEKIVTFSKHLVIYNVLYISKFTLNIMCVQRLVSYNFYQILDDNVSKIIGQTSMQQGLYQITQSTNYSIKHHIHLRNLHTTCKMQDMNLWHCRN